MLGAKLAWTGPRIKRTRGCRRPPRVPCNTAACRALPRPAVGSQAAVDTAPAPAASTPMSAASQRVPPPPNSGSPPRWGLAAPVPSPSTRQTGRRKKWPCLILKVSRCQVPQNPAPLPPVPVGHQGSGSRGPSTLISPHRLFGGKNVPRDAWQRSGAGCGHR